MVRIFTFVLESSPPTGLASGLVLIASCIGACMCHAAEPGEVVSSGWDQVAPDAGKKPLQLDQPLVYRTSDGRELVWREVAGKLLPGHDFSPRLIDENMTSPLADYGYRNRSVAAGQTTGTWINHAYAHAMSYLALVAWYQPERVDSKGDLLAARVAEHLAYVTSGTGGPFTSEPGCNGAMDSFWENVHFAVAATLAKRNPAVWNLLSPDQRDRIDWTMRFLTIASSYNSHLHNYPSHGLDADAFCGLGHSFDPSEQSLLPPSLFHVAL